jgi:indolepyruvate ferredoxin oxidoreductase
MDPLSREIAPLPERFTLYGAPVHLTGLQALARLVLEQVRRDRRSGLRTGGYISGYPGSPLAGFDQVLRAIEPLLCEHQIHFQLGLNEELAAAAVAGSQLVDLFAHRDCDGAIGMWYGKAPGVDRCLDVFRHANYTGISRFGGALAVAGDDPACKSSSLPSQSECAFAHAMIPLLAPSGAAEVIELGLHGYALSRYAGVWAGLKVVADVCDGGEIAILSEAGPEIRLPDFRIGSDGRSFEKRLDPRLLPPMVLEIERDLLYARLEAARRYVFENRLDRIERSHPGDRVGLVAAGVHHRALLSAFDHLALDHEVCRRLGIRVLKLAMIYPVEPRRLLEFAEGLETLIVLDDRRGLLEEQIRALLYDSGAHPRILGQRDEHGAPWLPRAGALEPEGLAGDLGALLETRCGCPPLRRRANAVRAHGGAAPAPLAVARRPHFCSGCPHLSSTRLPEGAAAAGGIGCHTMALLADREMRFFGAMGSEGAHWNGLAHFVDTTHLFQNLGDGTYFHSGRQAIRACVESGSRITFKLLFNHAVAMTGGQTATGAKEIAQLVRDLLSDGVRKVIAVSTDPALGRLARQSDRVELVAREASLDAMARLAREEGVSVFIHDQLCANQLQRRQRREGLAPPRRRIWIHQDLCEGCGDCGHHSECLSLRPVSTALGRKTQIHQGSCSQDLVCMKGDCPAFLSIDDGEPLGALPIPEDLQPPDRDPPLPDIGRDFRLLCIGVGSTGVVTLNAILMDAARREGLFAVHLAQTGLAQRGGRVTSHLRLSRESLTVDARVPWGGADTLLALDPLGAAEPRDLPRLSRERTRTFLHDCNTPTAEMVSDPDLAGPSFGELRDRLEHRSRELRVLPAEEVATALLGSHLCANIVLLGFAFQCGAIPLSSRALEESIAGRGRSVETNLAAFRLGRALVERTDRIPELLRWARPAGIGQHGDPVWARALYGELWEQLESGLRGQCDPETEVELSVQIAGWAADLDDYQNRDYGERYLRALLPVLREELAQHQGRLILTPVAARQLYRLMAYKDEYEVARLALSGPFRRWLDRRRAGGAPPDVWLRPPWLRWLGLSRKLRLPGRFEVILELLASLKPLRGSRFDPFGRSELRRVERELVTWYEDLLDRLCSELEDLGVRRAAEIAGHAALIRGYESIKLERAAMARERVDKALSKPAEGRRAASRRRAESEPGEPAEGGRAARRSRAKSIR